MGADRNRYFNEVYDKTYADVLKYVVTHCKNHADIQDIIQNTYMNFYIRYQKYGRLHFLNANNYIFRIARDELSKSYKNTSKVSQHISMDDEEITIRANEDLTLEDIICDECQIQDIWNWIRNKDTVTFKIFILYFLYDHKLGDIARELTISESGVKNRLYRTIRALKANFNEEDILV